MKETADGSISSSAVEERSRRVGLYGMNPLYDGALKSLIEHRAPGTIVTLAGDEQSLVASDPDVVLLDVDVDMPTEMQLGAVSALLQRVAPRPVIVIAGVIQPDVLQRLLREGVVGIVPKACDCDVLLRAIDAVSSGKVWLQRELVAQTFGDSSHTRRACSEAHKIAQLTRREREIVAVACSGLTNRQIAKRLQISEATVRHHLSSIFAKLGAANRAELIVFAYRHGLADEAERQRRC